MRLEVLKRNVYENSSLLGYYSVSFGSYRHFGGAYCLHLHGRVCDFTSRHGLASKKSCKIYYFARIRLYTHALKNL